MQKPLFPLSQIQDLKCRHCQKYISCGPIYVVPDSSVLCGRCRMLAKDIYRNFSYEALASIFRYPCEYWQNHCPISLQWNESLTHEDKCSYKGFWKMLCAHPGACFKGKREIMEGAADVKLTPVPEYLLDRIKCIQCECYLSCEPIYIQSNGKNICHRCIISNGVPPNCLRNIAYEKISRIFVFPCIFRNRGCPTRLPFGRELWQHESVCSYGQIFKKLPQKHINNNPNPSPVVAEITNTKKDKERGVITTHTGHTWGTITPNSQLFAPPDKNNNKNNSKDINKEVIKSLVKKQERFIKRADEIGSEFNRMNSSEEGSNVSRNSIASSSNNWEESNVHSPKIEVQVHYPPEDYPSNSSRGSSTRRSPDLVPSHMSETDNMLAGHFPIFSHHKTNSISSYDSGLDGGKRLSRHGSINGPRDLINELKYKQGVIKKTHSIRENDVLDSRNDPVSPYQQCQNLEDILHVHDRLKNSIASSNNIWKVSNEHNGKIEVQVHYPLEDYLSNSRRGSSTRRFIDLVPSHMSETDNMLAGHFPIFSHHKTNSISSYDSGLDGGKRLSRHGSINGPRDLINELKYKQGVIKKTHSIRENDVMDSRNDPVSPYQQCQNLEDILHVHDRNSIASSNNIWKVSNEHNGKIEVQVHYPPEDYLSNSSKGSSTRRFIDLVPSHMSETDNMLAGHFPIFNHHKTNSISSYDSGLGGGKRLSRHGSINGPRDLINELKYKQRVIKKTHSIRENHVMDSRNDPVSPYQQCQNLEDILHVHDRLK